MPSSSRTSVTASSSPVPWIEKNTGTFGLSFCQALTTPSAITSVRAKAPQKLIDQALHAGIGEHQVERDFGFGVGLAADLQEIRRPAAVMADHVHGGHGEAGAVGEHADIAVELDELEAGLGAALLQRGHRRPAAAAPAMSGLAVDRGIVEHEFAVERDHAAVREQRQRIDLDQLGVARADRRA